MLSSQITLVAGDPRVYDQSETTGTGTTITDAAVGGTVSYTNAGSIGTPPKIRIYGGITNPFVRKGTVAASVGAGLVFSGTVAPGDFLEIDVQARTVKTNGTTNSLSLLTAASSDFFELPTGSSTVCMTGSAISGSPRVDLIYRSAWA
jgi:phage-related protein